MSQVSGSAAFSLPSTTSYDDTARSLLPYAASGASTAASVASRHGADYWDGGGGAVAAAAVSRGKDAVPKNFDDYWNTAPPPSYAESTVKDREKRSEGTHSAKTGADAHHSRRASEQPMRQPEKAPRAINVGNVSSSTLSPPRPSPPAAKQATSTWHAGLYITETILFRLRIISHFIHSNGRKRSCNVCICIDDGERSLWCVALFDYNGELPCDLSFSEGTVHFTFYFLIFVICHLYELSFALQVVKCIH